MARDGTPYRGVLYAGLMLTDGGPMVLEFNARFGDPEAQVLLPMLDGDFAGALLGAAIGDRSAMDGSLGMRAGAAVGVVVASAGYPDAPLTGRPITGADPSGPADDGPILRFHAATRTSGTDYLSSGGRVATDGRVGHHPGRGTRALLCGRGAPCRWRALTTGGTSPSGTWHEAVPIPRRGT